MNMLIVEVVVNILDAYVGIHTHILELRVYQQIVVHFSLLLFFFFPNIPVSKKGILSKSIYKRLQQHLQVSFLLELFQTE